MGAELHGTTFKTNNVVAFNNSWIAGTTMITTTITTTKHQKSEQQHPKKQNNNNNDKNSIDIFAPSPSYYTGWVAL